MPTRIAMRRLRDRPADFGGASAPTHGMLAVHFLSSPRFAVSACLRLRPHRRGCRSSVPSDRRRALGRRHPDRTPKTQVVCESARRQPPTPKHSRSGHAALDRVRTVGGSSFSGAAAGSTPGVCAAVVTDDPGRHVVDYVVGFRQCPAAVAVHDGPVVGAAAGLCC